MPERADAAQRREQRSISARLAEIFDALGGERELTQEQLAGRSQLSVKESRQVRELRAGAVETWWATHQPIAGGVPVRGGSAAGDGGPPWTELQTQTLIYSQEALGLNDAGIARYMGRSPQAVARRAEELVRAGKLRPRAREGGIAGRPRRSWEELRPAI